MLRISSTSNDIEETTGSTPGEGTHSVPAGPLTEMQVAPSGRPPAPAELGRGISRSRGQDVGTEEDCSEVSTFLDYNAVPMKQRITQDQQKMITQGRLPRRVLDNSRSIEKKPNFADTGMPSSQREGALTQRKNWNGKNTNSLNLDKTTTQAQIEHRPDVVGIVHREELEKHAHEKFKEIMVGVSQGYTMNLELKGIGYQVRREGSEKPTQTVKTSTVSPRGDGYLRGAVPESLSGQTSDVLGLQNTGAVKAGGRAGHGHSDVIENPRYIGFLEILAYSQGTLPKVSGHAPGIEDTPGSYLRDLPGPSILESTQAAVSPAPATLGRGTAGGNGRLPHQSNLYG